MSSTSEQTQRRATKVKLPPASGGGAKRPPDRPPGRKTEPNGRGPVARIAGYLTAGLLGLAVIYALASSPSGDKPVGDHMNTKAGAITGTDSRFPYQVGAPGAGAAAPSFALGSTDGSSFDLAAQRGKTVLLYFQEGLGCQPCWDQMKAIEESGMLGEVGVDRLVSITTQPLDLLKQKAADEEIKTPVLSDPDLSVSTMYSANLYGMMGDSMDGHSFMLIDGNGKLLWRADYGGAPNYTMFVPVDVLKADIQQGLRAASAT